jgi:SAM-dependent methyltransferase
MSDLLDEVRRYYTAKFEAHGAEPAGVDWNSRESQELRFRQFFRLFSTEAFSLLDYGCGYGALLSFLRSRGYDVRYTGFDLASSLIEHARMSHVDAQFTTVRTELEPHDYAVASGVFNVKQDAHVETWTKYVEETIADLARLGAKGFAFNMLTANSEPTKMRPDLYYADPLHAFELCRSWSRHVALLHDYGLWEFTIVVRRD